MSDPGVAAVRIRRVAELLVRCSGVPLARVAEALGYAELGAFAEWFEGWSGEPPDVARCAWSSLNRDLRPTSDGPDEERLAQVRRALFGVLRRREVARVVRALRRRQPLARPSRPAPDTAPQKGELHDR